jgi:UDP-N-acetylmuramoylalanine--D-glutamate ligase
MSMAASPVFPVELKDLTLDSFAGQPVAVLGFARSGIALTRFLIDRGADVTVYDGATAAALGDAIEQLGQRRPRLLLGPDEDPREALTGQALVCTSPSVSSRYPTTEPRLRAALGELEATSRVPVLSEIDLFLRLCPAETIGVTGTKGKTTTSSLIATILTAGDAPVILGGNIGAPLVEQLPRLTAAHRVVLELSELQLPTISRGTRMAVYTHVTSDHLDRHGTLQAYRAAKHRLVKLLPDGGTLVRNDDDPVVRTYQAPAGATVLSYRLGPPSADGVGVAEGWVVGLGERVMPLEEIPIPGEHNISNVLAAVAVGLLHEMTPDAIRAAVAGFTGVEHRLEPVATIAGVHYVNDSQGTQPDAVIAAVRSFAKPLVLIAGGRSKGNPIIELSRAVADRVTAAVLIGETADELSEAFAGAGLERIERAGSMDQAVGLAAEIAAEDTPSTVLLSPAAASFDMFDDYEARGAAFKSAVERLGTSAR